MHSISPSERTASLSAGHYHSARRWRRRSAQSPEAAAARNISAESAAHSARVGYCAESAPRGCPSALCGPGAGDSPHNVAGIVVRKTTTVTRFLLLLPIRLYQVWLSPMLLPSCRFHPSCSAYAWEAIEKYGVGQGLVLAFRRLARCRPGGGYGLDPVP